MKFTLSWLKKHLDTSASLDEILSALTDLGLEVESVENPVEKLEKFTIGKVLSAEQHPNADKLRVCQVQTDEGELQIICGAPNAREGIWVVVAKPGVFVPGIETTIGVGKIRGVDSFGMMCSEREMQLSDEHDGIIELSSGEVGQKFVDWLSENKPSKVDPIIEIAITPNRPDALGVHGIARDLAARGLGKLIVNKVSSVQGSFPCPISVKIENDTLSSAPVFFGRVIKGVKNGQSPEWLQDYLKAIGLRPISTLVDITNYFTYDQNRPLHVFDADKIGGKTLKVHKATGGEKFIGLDEKEYTLTPGMVAISDSIGVESLGGIMGGLNSGCTSETENVFLEAAFFDPVRTAYTGRELKINSDARYRFERGIDPEWTPTGIEAATQLILELCGGEASDLVVAGKVPDTSRFYKFDPNKVQSLVGMKISEGRQREILTNLGFKLKENKAFVPAWRPDVLGEADIVEEIARVASLSNLKGIPLPRNDLGIPKPVLSVAQKREQMARRNLAALGYNECVSYSFIDVASATLFGGGTNSSQLQNPISNDMSHMRPDLLPCLLKAASRNQARGFNDIALFEVGPVFGGGEPDDQDFQISGLLVGQTSKKSVHEKARNIDVFDAKADLENTLSALGAPQKVQIKRGGSSWWHPGRHGCICLGPKNVLAVFGEIHPKVLKELDVKGPAVAFTIWPNSIPVPRNHSATRSALELIDLQAVERDFAFIVADRVEASDLVVAAAGADKKMIQDVKVFDEFIGEEIGNEKKSIAITVRLQPFEKTLTDAEIEELSKKVIEKVTNATGGILRT
ncbi:MAG: phenylalanine--tRNA ligase subunit beta [Paracoccaceae bacterium]